MGGDPNGPKLSRRSYVIPPLQHLLRHGTSRGRGGRCKAGEPFRVGHRRHVLAAESGRAARGQAGLVCQNAGKARCIRYTYSLMRRPGIVFIGIIECIIFLHTAEPAAVDNAGRCVGGTWRRLRGQDPAQRDAGEALRHRLHPREGLQGGADAAKGLPAPARHHRQGLPGHRARRGQEASSITMKAEVLIKGWLSLLRIPY